MIPRLSPDPAAPFPETETALDSPDGLLAWGGNLDPVRLTNAYHHGIFPWYSEDQPILWWCPSQRCVLYPRDVHVSRRLKRKLGKREFAVTADRAFSGVIAGCALPRKSQESTWITPEMIQAYTRLHHMGIAHSIEVWAGNELQGGLYGLAFGRMFFGESMFSTATDASKIALVALCRQMVEWRFTLLDCQVTNPHLESMGAVQLDRKQFLATLQDNLEHPSLAGSGSWDGQFRFTQLADE
jgi:leucyl/phenylalanyl-tRNA--protein transferase